MLQQIVKPDKIFRSWNEFLNQFRGAQGFILSPDTLSMDSFLKGRIDTLSMLYSRAWPGRATQSPGRGLPARRFAPRAVLDLAPGRPRRATQRVDSGLDRVVSFEIPEFAAFFFRKKSGKKSRTSFFLDSWDQNTILKILDFFYGQYFHYKPSFPSFQPSKNHKIKTTISKSTGLFTYSSFRPPGTCFSPVLWPKLPFFDLQFLYEAILGPLKACFEQLDQKKMKN